MNCLKNSYFIHPNFGYKWDRFEIGVSVRMNYLYLSRIETDLELGSSTIYYRDQYLIGKQSVGLFFADPAFSFKAGGDHVKFHLLSGGAVNLNSFAVRAKGFYLTLGVFISLSVPDKNNTK